MTGVQIRNAVVIYDLRSDLTAAKAEVVDLKVANAEWEKTSETWRSAVQLMQKEEDARRAAAAAALKLAREQNKNLQRDVDAWKARVAAAPPAQVCDVFFGVVDEVIDQRSAP
jgi:Arc/MetJ-type ribon-helix-helix transcriptional regulator